MLEANLFLVHERVQQRLVGFEPFFDLTEDFLGQVLSGALDEGVILPLFLAVPHVGRFDVPEARSIG